MTTVSFVTKLLSLGTVLSQLFIVIAIIYYVFARKAYPNIATWFKKHGMMLAFLVSLASMCGSLFYSNIAMFAPCEFCWFQRIFMYPLVFLLGLALLKKDKRIIDYALLLAGIGFVVSLYQNYMYYFNQGLTALCQLGGAGGVSCVKRYIFEFGYITIPLMALTAFVVIIVLLVAARQNQNQAV